ncbi:MAG: hypothetical protein AB1424_05100 [Thermodesulfobacteriota bacterium]
MDVRGEIKKNLLDLFHKWADPQLEQYEEPERVGVPRGEPVGFSAKKFHAALAMVLKPSFTLAEIADLVGVSDGQVRVWRTEESFKKLAEELQTGFLHYLADRLDHDARNNDFNNYRDIFICLALFPNGIYVYHKKLIETLVYLSNEINQHQNDHNLYVDMKELMSQFVMFFKMLFSKEEAKDKKDEVMQRILPLINGMLDFFISVLHDPEKDEKIKEEAAAMIKMIALFCFV